MRWFLALVALVSVADARPVKAQREVLDPFADDGYGPCERGKKWARVTRCLQKSGKVSMLYELEGVKLVGVRYDSMRDASTVYVYVERDGLWRRGNAYVSTNANSELLSFKKLDDRPGYRIDLGVVTPSSTSFDAITNTKIVLLRKYTTVCGADAMDCRTLMTACDAFVGGKAFWSFRGALVWEGRNVKVTGDSRNGGRLCTPPKTAFTPLAELE